MRKLITVTTLGDAAYEPANESFYVNLTASGVSGSSDRRGECTLVDDDPNASPTIDYASFSQSSRLELVGDARIDQSRLRLTKALGNRQTGAGWYLDQQPVANGFKASFRFTPQYDVGTAFVIHNSPTGRGQLGAREGGVGYDGIENSLVVVFNEVHRTAAVHHNGTGVNKATEEFVRVIVDWPNANDPTPQTAVVEYVPAVGGDGGTLRVFIDGAFTPLLTLAIDLDATFNLNNGKMWVGFTASSFNYHEHTHDILSWQFTPFPAALEAATAGPNTGAAPLSQRQAQALLPEALARWQAAGADISSLANVSLRIADLGGRTLGLA